MSLSTKIAAGLDENTTVHIMPCAVTIDDGPHRVTLSLTALDTVGMALDSLDFATTSRPEWSADALRAWGERLSSRVTYLMEPLKVLEVDAEGGEVAIRSQNPTAKGDGRSYFEVRLSKPGTLHLERRTIEDVSRERRQTACNFTREVVERLADDIIASLP